MYIVYVNALCSPELPKLQRGKAPQKHSKSATSPPPNLFVKKYIDSWFKDIFTYICVYYIYLIKQFVCAQNYQHLLTSL